jgi:paraquat-inducible protein B
MSKPANPKLIGAFVLGAVALIIGGVIVLGGGKVFQRRTPIVMFFQGSVSGLSVGSVVNFRGVRVGQVTNVFIRYQPDGSMPLIIPVFAELTTDNVQVVGMPSHETSPGRATGENLRELVDRGLRAQLALPSLVTGAAMVSLDFFPASPAEFLNTYPERVEIPTVPSTLQEVQSTLQAVYQKISQLPLDELVEDTRNVVKGANRLVNDPQVVQAVGNASRAMVDLQQATRTLDSRIGPLISSLETTSDAATRTLRSTQDAIARLQAGADEIMKQTDATMQAAQKALAQADRTLKAGNAVLEPGGTVNYEVVSALREVASAARSLRDLSDQLQRSPNSLLFGRPLAAAPK